MRLAETRYVWKPERPKIDQTEKKQTTNSIAVERSKGEIQKTEVTNRLH